MRITTTVALAAAATLLVTSSSHAADSCAAPCAKPPNNARTVSVTGTPLGDFFTTPNLLSATLAKGKKKNLLIVHGILTDGPYTPFVISRVLALGVDVNGLPMQPSPAPNIYEAIEDCGAFRTDADPDGACTVTAEWWLDFDDPANAALITSPVPPLVITLNGGVFTAGAAVGSPVDMSLSVRLQKK